MTHTSAQPGRRRVRSVAIAVAASTMLAAGCSTATDSPDARTAVAEAPTTTVAPTTTTEASDIPEGAVGALEFDEEVEDSQGYASRITGTVALMPAYADTTNSPPGMTTVHFPMVSSMRVNSLNEGRDYTVIEAHIDVLSSVDEFAKVLSAIGIGECPSGLLMENFSCAPGNEQLPVLHQTLGVEYDEGQSNRIYNMSGGEWRRLTQSPSEARFVQITEEAADAFIESYNAGEMVDGFRVDLVTRGPNTTESSGQVEFDANGNVTARCASAGYVNFGCDA